MNRTIRSHMQKQLSIAFKVRKHIPYKLLRTIVKSKMIERDIYSLTVDYSSHYPLLEMKQSLIMHAENINRFMENIEHNSYPDLQTPEEIEQFKKTFIEHILYFFKEKEMIEIFSAIEVFNFNTSSQNVLAQVPGSVLKTSKKLGTFFHSKADCLKLTDDLRAFFDYFFLERHRYTVYGVYENSQKFDKEKIVLFFVSEIFSKNLIDEILHEERKSYFQKNYSHHYWGVVSYKVLKEQWKKLI